MKPADHEQQEELNWVIEQELAGERIDKFISDFMEEGISRTQVQAWIKRGHVKVNGKEVKSNYKLQTKDVIHATIPLPVDLEIAAEPIPLDVVFEDGDMIVVNKPRGMVVHPAPGHYSGTLVNGLLYHCRDLSGINGVLRPGIVHRIDKDTSGLLMAAKNDKAHHSLAAQLKDHTVTRKYLALVRGKVAHNQGTIDAPIGRDPYDRKLYTVTQTNSKQAITHFSILEKLGDYTLLELKLETGRTHQIRVHLKFIGHPLVGDPAYGRTHTAPIAGQALHAATLGFTHPRLGDYMEFHAPMPEDMERLLEELRKIPLPEHL